MPLKVEELLKVATKNGGPIITVEDNYTGGLDAELAIGLATSGAGLKLKHLYVTQIPKSGREPDDVLNALSLGQKQILASVG
jgi:deoxyxylulose-5-phosphate synthase